MISFSELPCVGPLPFAPCILTYPTNSPLTGNQKLAWKPPQLVVFGIFSISTLGMTSPNVWNKSHTGRVLRSSSAVRTHQAHGECVWWSEPLVRVLYHFRTSHGSNSTVPERPLGTVRSERRLFRGRVMNVTVQEIL